MSNHIWMSPLSGVLSSRRLYNSFYDADSAKEERLRAITRKIEEGAPITADEVPEAIFGGPMAKENHYKFPHFFYVYGFWIVSSAAADVFRQFDLGGGGLYPVKAFKKKDLATPIDGEWFCLNFGNVKHSFLPDESANKTERYIRDGRKGWFLRAAAKDMDFAVTSSAIGGPDIWLDYDVGDAFFLSAPLGDALKKAKADKGFKLMKCRVI
jgi:hypothetical protein